MQDSIRWLVNTQRQPNIESIYLMNRSEVAKAQAFHARLPDYQPTPLQPLSHLAARLGVAGIYVKDESQRFGLNAFKALGASYAIARYLGKRLNSDNLTHEYLTSEAVKQQLGEVTFVTATDGNHGRGVAWTAKMLRQKAVVYLPKGASELRVKAIRDEGAEAYVTDGNYDDAVRLAAENAAKYGWVLVQDTALAGYEEVPTWIMQGYGTMAAEAWNQLRERNVEPTHIFVQAGVGSMAAAVQGYAAWRQPEVCLAVVEADKADCLFQSALSGDGRMVTVGGDLPTIMAGLACGEPNRIGWHILRDYAHVFAACPDYTAALGMRILGNPLKDDPRIVSGESGAVTTGLLYKLLCDRTLSDMRKALGLNENSQVLLFSTEGDTDPQKYRSIVWGGEYACQL